MKRVTYEVERWNFEKSQWQPYFTQQRSLRDARSLATPAALIAAADAAEKKGAK